MSNDPIKLSNSQLIRIINRFTVSKSSSLPLLSQPFQTTNHIIATNAYMSLFLSNEITSETINNKHQAKEEISAAILKLEEYHMTHSNYVPSTQLSLDSASIQAIIKALQAEQSSMKTMYTKTRIIYSKRTNELILTTIKSLDRFTESRDNILPKKYYKPSSVSKNRGEDFSLIINTNYLIDSLKTQDETNQFTTVEYDLTQSSHIKLVNDISTIVIARISE